METTDNNLFSSLMNNQKHLRNMVREQQGYFPKDILSLASGYFHTTQKFQGPARVRTLIQLAHSD